jgi:hypothetical protein
MAVSEGDNILNTQFNNLVDRLVSNYASYMGQQLRSGTTTKSSTSVISASDWNDLAEDIMDFLYYSTTGEFDYATTFNTYFGGSVFDPGFSAASTDEIDDADYNTLESALDTAILRAGQLTNFDFAILNSPSASYELAWNGRLEIDQIWGFPGGYTYTTNSAGATAVATPAVHRQHFSRALGGIIAAASSSGATSDKDLDWSNMIDNLSYTYTTTDYSNTTFVNVASSTGNSTYSNNVGNIQVKVDDFTGTGKFVTRLSLQDLDSGNPDDYIDEDVDTNVAFSVNIKYPSRLPNDLQPVSYNPVVSSQGSASNAATPVFAKNNITFFDTTINPSYSSYAQVTHTYEGGNLAPRLIAYGEVISNTSSQQWSNWLPDGSPTPTRTDYEWKWQVVSSNMIISPGDDGVDADGNPITNAENTWMRPSANNWKIFEYSSASFEQANITVSVRVADSATLVDTISVILYLEAGAN